MAYGVLWVIPVLLVSAEAFYENTDVIELNPSNFQDKVINSNEVWIVQFYAPWCRHSVALKPEYSKAAAALKGVVKVAAVDADQYKELRRQYEITGYPTIKIFGGDKDKPQHYKGQRTAQKIVDAAFRELKNIVEAKLGGGDKSGESKSH